MAIKENQLTVLSNISISDRVRIVTLGGASNSGRVETLASTILGQYESNFISEYESVNDAFGHFSSDNGYMGQGYGQSNELEPNLSRTANIPNYRRVTGGIVTIRFLNGVSANATLNISDTGASPIYYRNTNIKSGVIRGYDICTFMYDGSHYVLISKDSPIIVETGTTANWKYIKYSDGRVDLSTTLSLAAAEGSQWVSGQPFYYQDTNISMPSGMLTETPSDIVATSGNTQWWIFGVWASNSNTLRARLVKIVSSAQAAVVRVRVIGKWR
ncbi:MAG: hypothetical protein IKF22_08665 [Lachnospiraceae bacterium]|nr:hypothetical protein [Lachnospiraceae bacterium]